MLIQRGADPLKGAWAFPYGFMIMNMDETTEQCAVRELEEETDFKVIVVHQVGAYSKVDRDPRGCTITVANLAIIDSLHEVHGQDDATKAKWLPINDIPTLTFDHSDIMADAVKLYETKKNIEEE